jgi:hypothetical protein
MAFIIKDRVKESTTTTGTGAISLGGSVATFDAFSAYMNNGDTAYYAIVHTTSGVDEWEVGLGTWNTGNTLTRTTVLSGSNGTSAETFSSGPKDVFMTYPAAVAAYTDGSGDLSGDMGLGNHSTTELVEGSNLYYTDARVDARLSGGTGVTYNAGAISIGQSVATTADATFNTVTVAGDPTSGLHLATKEYVDTIASAGIHYHDPVRAEHPTNLAATYNNGSAGVGATLTNSGTNAAIVLDGVSLDLNDRVLVANQTNQTQNGVYSVTTVGSGSAAWVLTRTTDTDSYSPSDPDSFGKGDAFFIKEGTSNAGHLDVLTTAGAITFGTTNIHFAEVAETTVYSAGTGLNLTGTTFATKQDISTTSSPTFNTVTANLTGNVDGNVDGNVTGNVTGDVTGNADTATALATARNIQLTGDVTGTASFNGSSNAVITAVVQDDSHSHVISNVDGLQTALDGKADETRVIGSGNGLTGGGNLTANRTFNVGAGSGITVSADAVSHADTSSQGSSNNSGRTYIQDVTLDTFGHVTGLSTATETVTNTTYTAGNGLGLSGTVFSHTDTSSQASVNNSNGTVIQDITLDTFGHITGIASTNLDGRYYTETEADSRFVNVTGDTMTGLLIAENGIRIGTGNHATDGRASLTFGEGSPTTDSMYIEYDGENLGGDANAIIFGSTKAGVGDIFSVTYGGAVKVGSNAVFHDGYHPNADKWTTARTLSLTGDVTGSVTWDGSGNASVTTAVADNSHNHQWINDDVSSNAPSDSLQYLNTNGSTTDSPTTDWYNTIRMGHGNPNSYYNNTLAMKMTGTGVGALYGRTRTNGTAGSWNRFFADNYHPNADKWTTSRTLTLTGDVTGSVSWDGSGNASITTAVGNDSHTHDTRYMRTDTPSLTSNIDTISSKSAVVRWNNATTGRPASSQSNEYGPLLQMAYDGNAVSQLAHDFDQDNLYFRKLTTSSDTGTSWKKIWNSGNDGSGSGLDADTLDGQHRESFGATLATYGSTAGASGRIRCTAPFNTNSGHMFQITVSVYSSYAIHNYVVGGYMYSTTNQWYSPATVYSGTGSPDILVGRDSSGKAYISIANGNYTGVRVHSMTLGYATSVADTYDPWTITINGATENSVGVTIHKTWTSANDGDGSGLDADLLDGHHQGSFMRRNANSQLDMNNNDIVGVNNIFHEGDSNTYMGFHNADQWRVVTGGTERLEINNDNAILAANLKINSHYIDMDLNNVAINAIDMEDVRASTWPLNFTTNVVGNDNESGFWVNSNGYPDMRLRRENGTVRALISSWEQSYVSNGFRVEGTTDLNGNLDVSGTSVFAGQLTMSNKKHLMGASNNWDAVGFTQQTNLHFQGHNQFWIGAGNGTWFTGTGNSQSQESGLAADASKAHDLLLATMYSDSTHDRGITFGVDSNGAGTDGWRLGKWHSGDAKDSSKLVIDGGLFAKGGYTDEYDYYANDYSAYYSSRGGAAYWGGDTGWEDPSITASTAIQIQSGNAANNTRNPALQFHQFGYGGVQLRYDGPDDRLHIEATAAGRMNYTRIKTSNGYIDFGPANTSHAHIYTDRPDFYFNKELKINNNLVWNAGNDGSGSGLDADLLDGNHASAFALSGHTHDSLNQKETITYGSSTLQYADRSGTGGGGNGQAPYNPTSDWYYHLIMNHANNGGYYADLAVCFHTNNHYITRMTNGSRTTSKIWTDLNDGSGSGLDADLLDGVQGSSYLRSDTSDTASTLTINTLTIGSSAKINFANNDSISYNDGDGVGGFSFNADAGTNNARVRAGAYYGDGSNLTGIATGANNDIFWENGQTVTSNYTITNGKNAMSAGPITINSGVTVTVGAGETWTVV